MRSTLLVALPLIVSFPACVQTTTTQIEPAPVPGALLERPFLYEVARHLYRWYMDEADANRAAGQDGFVFWVRSLDPPLDPGDHSRMGEVILPALGIVARVKQADYAVPELDLVVKNDGFRITNVARAVVADRPPPGCTVVQVDYAEMKDVLYRTRFTASFPEGALLTRIRQAARRQLLEEGKVALDQPPAGDQVIYLSPISLVANEIWAYWETGRVLLRFSSDIDLINPTVWVHEELATRLYDVDEQVVVSLDEVPGSNAYLTRDQVGRALFNCIVLGRRVVLRPFSNEEIRGAGE